MVKGRGENRGSGNKAIALTIFGLFLVSLFVIGFFSVSPSGHAVDDVIVSGDGTVVYICTDGTSSTTRAGCNDASSRAGSSSSEGSYSGFIASLFTDWGAGALDVNVAKFLFLIILTILIFSALSFAQFPERVAMQWLIAIPIGFLVTAYITPEEVFTALTAYTALGLALSVFIPFVILLFFSAMLLSNQRIHRMTVPKVMMQVFLWLLFIAFLIYKGIVGYSHPSIGFSNGMRLAMGIVLLLSVLIFLFNRRFRDWIRSLGIEIREAVEQVEAHEVERQRRAGGNAPPHGH